MSSNEPLPTLSDDTIQALNQAIETWNSDRLQTLIKQEGIGQTLNVSFLDEAWKRYKNTPYTNFTNCSKKDALLLTVFDHCHFREGQRRYRASQLCQYALKTNKISLLKDLLSRLDPLEEIAPFTEHLILISFFNDCDRPGLLSHLLHPLPEDKRFDLCKEFIVHLHRSNRYVAERMLSQPEGLPDQLLKGLACFLSSLSTANALTALSDDWQTVFANLSPGVIHIYHNTLITRETLPCLLASREESQRLELLQSLSGKTRFCLQNLNPDKEQLQNVLQLLPKSQRIQLFLADSRGRRIYEHVPDALWPVIKPLLEPSDIRPLLQSVLMDNIGATIGNLVNTLSTEDIWQAWQQVFEGRLSSQLADTFHLPYLLEQLPTDAQKPIREQLLGHLFEHHREQRLGFAGWIRNKWCFSTLFPEANQWIKDVAGLRGWLFHERLSKLAKKTVDLHALLDHIPESERRILIIWLVNVNVHDVDILNGLIDKYIDSFCLNHILPECWYVPEWNWTDSMPRILALMEHLPKSERHEFVKLLSAGMHQGWQPGTYQAVCHAHALFGLSAAGFLYMVGLNNRAVPLTPLMQAACDNDRNAAEQHIQSLNEQDWLGRTALMHAFIAKNFELAQWLVEQPGCDFSLRTLHDQTVFSLAVLAGNTFALQQLLKVGRCKPGAEEALTVLYSAQSNTVMLDFLFKAYLPNITWQATESLSDPIQYLGQNHDQFRRYYAKAMLPFDLANKQLSILELNPDWPGMFHYQMRALGVPVVNTINWKHLLKTLAGQKLESFHLNRFHINAYELPDLLAFIKGNPELKSLILGTLHWHPEDEPEFLDALRDHPGLEIVQLEIHDRPAIRFSSPKSLAKHRFFAQPAAGETVAGAQVFSRAFRS